MSSFPCPREHQLTYHGVLAPASPLQGDVVPLPTSRQAHSGQWAGPPPSAPAPRKRFSWAELLRRVFAVDVLACPRCKGRRHFVSVITDPALIRRILEHLKLPTESLALAPPPAQLALVTHARALPQP